MRETAGGASRDGGGLPLRLGVLGLGRGASSLLPSIDRHPDIELVAAADRDRPRAEEFAADFGAAGFGSVDELVSDPHIDAVYVATPHQDHASHACAAAEAGKHVLIEKPMALSASDCEAIINASDAAGVVVVVGPSHGSDPSVLLMREMLRSERFGRLRLLWAIDHTDFLYRPRRPEELDTSLGGGVLFNQLPHHVDMVRTVHGSGDPVSLRAHLGTWDKSRPTEGAYTVTLEMAGEVPATLVYSGYAHFDTDEWFDWVGEMGAPKDRGVMASTRQRLRGLHPGEEGAVKHSTGYQGRPQIEEIAASDRRHPHFGLLVACADRADLVQAPDGVNVYSDDGWEFIEASRGRGGGSKAGALDELVDAVTGDRPALHDARWGAVTTRICLAALASGTWGREVRLDEPDLLSPADLLAGPSPRKEDSLSR